MNARIVGLLASFVLCGASAHADPITQPTAAEFWNIDFFAPFGQSFTAEDGLIGIVGVIVTQFHDVPDPFSVQYDLYSGVGAHGTPLATRTFNGSGSFLGFADVSFAGVPLMVGTTYSLILTSHSTMGVFAGSSFNQADPYPGGTLIAGNQSRPDVDLAFHVLPAGASPTPEPASLLLLGTGIAAMSLRRSRGKPVE